MNPSQLQTSEALSEAEKDHELKVAEAEAAVVHGARNLRRAVGHLTQAIPNSAPIQAVNTIGKISAGVGSAKKNVVARVRANPAPYILVSVASLIALFLLVRTSRKT